MTDDAHGRATGDIPTDAAAAKHTQEEMAQFGAYLTLRAQAYILNEIWHGKYSFAELREKALDAATHANNVAAGRWPHVEIASIPLAAVLGHDEDPNEPQEPVSPVPGRETERPETDTATPSSPAADLWRPTSEQQHEVSPGVQQEMAAAV